LELVRLIQGAFMVWDMKMESDLKLDDDSVKKVSARANNTNLNEDLAQISYIFSDKTGTFTKNEMKLAKWFVDDVVYDELESPGSLGQAAVDESTTAVRKDKLCRMLRSIAVCHDVIPSIDHKSGKMVYESQSPDETALVMAAKSNNAILKSRNKSFVEIEVFGHNEKYQIVQVLTFNSTRKRMSVVVKDKDNYILYCKGADNVIQERLSKDTNLNDPELLKMAAKKLEAFSEVGLRVLMIAWRNIPEDEYNKFQQILNQAEECLEDREEKVMNAYEILEKDMIFTGCTAIEDKLQDDLPETIKYLLIVNIVFILFLG
jgi:phospholipid-transporting ATPase